MVHLNIFDEGALKNEMEFCRQNNLDFYKYKAQQLFCEKYSAITNAERNATKTYLFGFMYSYKGRLEL